jgi:hypothetical protein
MHRSIHDVYPLSAGCVVAISQAGVADSTDGFVVGPRITSIKSGGAATDLIKTSFDYVGFGHLKDDLQARGIGLQQNLTGSFAP